MSVAPYSRIGLSTVTAHILGRAADATVEETQGHRYAAGAKDDETPGIGVLPPSSSLDSSAGTKDPQIMSR